MQVFELSKYNDHYNNEAMFEKCPAYQEGQVNCFFCGENIMQDGLDEDDAWFEHLKNNCISHPKGA